MTKNATPANGEAMPSLTRRAAIVGALVSSAALAVPAAAALNVPTLGAIALAIAEHRRLNAASMDAYDEQEAAEARLKKAMGGSIWCEVQVGNLIGTCGAPNKPIMAHSHEEIDKHCETWVRTCQNWPGREKQADAYRARFGLLHDDLTAQLQRRDRLAAETGYAAAQANSKARTVEEDQAGARLVLLRPQTPEEAEAKRAYLDEVGFSLYGEDFLDLVLAACVEVA